MSANPQVEPAILLREDRGGLCTLTMNRPQQMNLLTTEMLSSLQEQAGRMDKQSQFLTSLYMSNNPDALYHMAMEDEARGDAPAAAKKLAMAIQLSEYAAQQYKIKLQQMMTRGN